MQAKTLILNSGEDNSFKAVVNLKGEGKSSIKFFCRNSLPSSLAIGIKQNKRVVKIPLSIKENVGEFEAGDVDLKEKILCAVVNVSNPFCPQILLSGSQNSIQINENIENAFVQGKPEDRAVLYEEESQGKIEELIEKNLKEDEESTYFDVCAKCKYREAFYKEGGSVCYRKIPQKEGDFEEKSQHLKENGGFLGENEENNCIISGKIGENSGFLVGKGENCNYFVEKDERESLAEDENLCQNKAQNEGEGCNFFEKIDDKSGKLAEGVDFCQNKANNEGERCKSLGAGTGFEKKVGKKCEEDEVKKFEGGEEKEECFYEQVKPQIDALFDKYESCEELGQIIPFSKWAKIVYDKEGSFYVLGLIFEEGGDVLYICYGMPTKGPDYPPEELENYAVFVPKNIAYPEGEGFFVVCQDAMTGKTLKIDLI